MSAHIESLSRQQTNSASQVELEALLLNLDHRDLVAPVREVHAAHAGAGSSPVASEERCRAALELQEKWEGWLVRRELLRNDVKRGKELLQHTRQELARLRSQLEDWPAYERVCGKNPIIDYMESITAQERVEHFLPGWLQRRETELATLTRSLEKCARQNGLEHLL